MCHHSGRSRGRQGGAHIELILIQDGAAVILLGILPQVWTLCLNGDESRALSAGSDSVINIWRDATQEEDKVRREQQEAEVGVNTVFVLLRFSEDSTMRHF